MRRASFTSFRLPSACVVKEVHPANSRIRKVLYKYFYLFHFLHKVLVFSHKRSGQAVTGTDVSEERRKKSDGSRSGECVRVTKLPRWPRDTIGNEMSGNQVGNEHNEATKTDKSGSGT